MQNFSLLIWVTLIYSHYNISFSDLWEHHHNMVLSAGFVHSLLGFRLGRIRERAQSVSNIPPGINARANSCYYTSRYLVTTLTCPEEVTDCKTTESFCFLILDLSWAAWTNICSSYLKTQICKATMCLKWQSYTNFLFFTEHFYSSSTDSNLVRSAKSWQIEIPAQKEVISISSQI